MAIHENAILNQDGAPKPLSVLVGIPDWLGCVDCAMTMRMVDRSKAKGRLLAQAMLVLCHALAPRSWSCRD